jgi:hypothetical protein
MLLLLYEEQRQPSSFTVLVSISSTHKHTIHGKIRTVQLLQILTHTLLLARQLYDFQLPVILPLNIHVN